MKKIIAFLFLLCMTMNALAYDFVANHIYYTITSSTGTLTVAVSGSETQSASIVLPSTVTNGSTSYNVTSIGNSAFWNASWLTNITLPSTLKSIESNAFTFCHGLQAIVIPASVTSIGSNAFYECQLLNSIALSTELTSIADLTFKGCYKLTSITIPKNVSSISSTAFTECPNLREINVEKDNPSYKSINGVLFNGDGSTLIYFPYSNSTNYTIPEGVTTIGYQAFNYCMGLAYVTIPTSVKTIKSEAFANCFGLNSLTIPASVTSLGDYAFSGCTGLYSLTMAGGFTSVGNNVFNNTYNIHTLFSGGTSEAKELLNIFNITNLYILEGTKSIEYSAFSGFTSLKSIYIPSSVTYIGVFAFGMCTKLENIHCGITSPFKINSNVFFAANIDACKLYVPTGSYNSYRNAVTWGDFANIIEEIPVSINQNKQSNTIVCNDRNSVFISGSNRGEQIYIYNRLGILEKSVIMEGNEMRINLPSNALYLIKINEKMFKVAL
jgi:hypothetical protein